MVTDWEAALHPDLRGKVHVMHIRYTGLGPDGEPVSTEASGLHARVVQHEIDHLHATLYLDRMSDMKSLMFVSETRHHKEEQAMTDVMQQAQAMMILCRHAGRDTQARQEAFLDVMLIHVPLMAGRTRQSLLSRIGF